MGIFKKLMKKRPSTKAAGGIKKSLRKERDIPKVPRGEKKPGVQPKKPAKTAVPNLDPAMMNKVRSKLIKGTRGSSNSSKPVTKKTLGSGGVGSSQKDQPSEVSKVKKKIKGPGFKSGGMASKGKATGAATKGFGKAYMKGKRS
jgi:hypothetical protein